MATADYSVPAPRMLATSPYGASTPDGDAHPRERVRSLMVAVCRAAEASPLINPTNRKLVCANGGGVASCLKPHDVAHNGALAPSPATATVAVQIRKAGSMQINALRTLFERTARQQHQVSGRTLAAERRSSSSDSAAEGGALGNGTAWTFVREPLARLLAGYADIEGRLVEPHGVCLPFGSNWTRGSEPAHTMLPAAAVGNFSALDADRRNIWTGQAAIAARCRWELSLARDREALFFRRHTFGSVARVRTFYQQLLSGELLNFQYVRVGSRTINHAYPMCHFLCADAKLCVLLTSHALPPHVRRARAVRHVWSLSHTSTQNACDVCTCTAEH